VAANVARTKRWAKLFAERIVYRVAGLPVAVRGLTGPPKGPASALRAAFADHYWNPESLGDLAELMIAALIWPVGLVLAAAWFTGKNGAIIAGRSGK
jgi:hypothetical protein